jgi:hypothetical protein
MLVAAPPAMSMSVLLALCPSCPTNQEAKSLVLSEAFWTNAAYAVLPFLVAGFVVHKLVTMLDRGVVHAEDE